MDNNRTTPERISLNERARLFLRDNFVYGADGPRRAYIRARMLMNGVDVLRRQRLAKTLAPSTALAIDESDGYRVLPSASLPLGDGVAEATRERCRQLGLDELNDAYLEDFVARSASDGVNWMVSGGRITRLLDKASLTPESPFLRFALDPDLLAAISVYLGVVPVLSAMDIWASLPTHNLRGPQRFHCDWADDRHIRVFVYATDVTAESGPLKVVAAEQSQTIRKAINYRYDGRGPAFQSDDAVTGSVADTDCQIITGAQGTVAFIDTCRCFHCGSRLELGQKPRQVAMFQYSRPGSFFLSAKYRKLAPFIRHASAPGLTPLQRQVLGK